MRHARRPLFVEDPQTGKRWPIPQGAAEDDDDQTDENADESSDGDDEESQEDDDGDDDGEEDDDAPLGPAGEKALQSLKQQRRDLKRQLREERAKNGKAAEKNGDDELDADQLRQQIRDEVAAESARDRALDKLEARAARTFHNPEDARAFLASQADDFLDDKGKPDVEVIDEALEELLAERPYLGLDAAQRRRFEGKADGGSRNGGKPGQLTREELAGMSPEAIDKAREEGRLDRVLGIKR